jgi:hypothetical protein
VRACRPPRGARPDASADQPPTPRAAAGTGSQCRPAATPPAADGTGRPVRAAVPLRRPAPGNTPFSSGTKVNKGTVFPMNPPEEITPEHAGRLVGLLGMMGDLSRDALAFLVGHMAARDTELAIEAYAALMATELPAEGV